MAIIGLVVAIKLTYTRPAKQPAPKPVVAEQPVLPGQKPEVQELAPASVTKVAAEAPVQPEAPTETGVIITGQTGAFSFSSGSSSQKVAVIPEETVRQMQEQGKNAVR